MSENADNADRTVDEPNPSSNSPNAPDLTIDSPIGADRTKIGSDDNQNFTVDLPNGGGTVDHDSGGRTQDFDLINAIKVAQRLENVKVPGYEIIAELGHGGMGVVYKARDPKLDRTVALKMILAGIHASTTQLERFTHEAKAVAQFQHPNIVQIYQIGEADGLPYFALEFVDGGSLDEKLDHKPQPPKFAAEMLETLAKAMQYAHDRHIVHRDLKPGNILLTRDGTPKIADFGLAKRQDDSSKTQAGQAVGTPNYMAPEQARGDIDAVGPHSDQAALGAILYEMLTGRPPYVGASLLHTLELVQKLEPVPPSQFNSEVPRDLETICLKCLQKEPAKRYASCSELVQDLRNFQEGKPIKARPVGQIERTLRWAKRNPTVTSLGAAAALLLLAVAVGATAFAFYYKDSAEKQRGLREVANRRLENVREREEVQVNTIPELVQRGLYTEQVFQAVLNLINENHNEIQESDDRHIQARAEAGKHQRRGLGFLRKRMFKEAIVEFKVALGIHVSILKDHPPDIDKSEGNVAATHSAIGDAYKLQGRPKYPDALESYKKALEIRRRIVQQPRSNDLKTHERLTALAAALTGLADLYSNMGKYSDAVANAHDALDVYKQVDRGALKVRDRQSLAVAWFTSGRAKFRTNNREGGRTDLDKAFEELKALIKDAKPNLSIQEIYAYLLRTAGDLEFIYAKDAKLALNRYREAAKIFTDLASPREILNCRRNLSQADYVLAVAALEAGDRATAEKAMQESAAIRKELVAKFAGDPEFMSVMYEAMLSCACARLIKDAEAFATRFERGGKNPKMTPAFRPELLKRAAQGFGLIADAVTRDDAVPLSPQLKNLRQSYLDRAYACLNEAIHLGYRNSQEFETDPDFAPFRSDPRYTDALAKLKKRL